MDPDLIQQQSKEDNREVKPGQFDHIFFATTPKAQKKR